MEDCSYQTDGGLLKILVLLVYVEKPLNLLEHFVNIIERTKSLLSHFCGFLGCLKNKTKVQSGLPLAIRIALTHLKEDLNSSQYWSYIIDIGHELGSANNRIDIVGKLSIYSCERGFEALVFLAVRILSFFKLIKDACAICLIADLEFLLYIRLCGVLFLE